MKESNRDKLSNKKEKRIIKSKESRDLSNEPIKYKDEFKCIRKKKERSESKIQKMLQDQKHQNILNQQNESKGDKEIKEKKSPEENKERKDENEFGELKDLKETNHGLENRDQIITKEPLVEHIENHGKIVNNNQIKAVNNLRLKFLRPNNYFNVTQKPSNPSKGNKFVNLIQKILVNLRNKNKECNLSQKSPNSSGLSSLQGSFIFPRDSNVDSKENQNNSHSNKKSFIEKKTNCEQIEKEPQSTQKPNSFFIEKKKNSFISNQPTIIQSARLPESSNASSNIDIPLKPQIALKLYRDCLTSYEKGEILDFHQIYYVGEKIKKQKYEMRNCICFDNDENDYIVNIYDHIYYRYEILSMLGIGSFGQTIKCFDHKTKEFVAVKIIKNKKQFTKQGFIEIKLLQFIQDHDSEKVSNVVNIKEYFMFRNHLCIVFDLLSMNLYDLLKLGKFKVV